MSQSLIDPELRSAARLLPRAAVHARTIRLTRALTGLAVRSRSADVTVEIVSPTASVRVHRPAQGPVSGAGLLWMHAGGYVMGSARQEDTPCRRFANKLGIVVAAVEYRLAPEHPFPASLEDCYAALKWLAGQADVDPARVAVGGGSAGGGLAAQLALLARDRGEIQPALQLLAYPMLDDRTALRTDIDQRNFRLWNNKANRFGWQSYLGTAPGSADVASVAVPARCADLAGVAPAWIGVGALDLFHDESVAYAGRLAEVGVRCDLTVVPGAFHAFDLIRPKAAISRSFTSAQLAALGSA